MDYQSSQNEFSIVSSRNQDNPIENKNRKDQEVQTMTAVRRLKNNVVDMLVCIIFVLFFQTQIYSE